MTQWGCLSQPITPRSTATSASDIRAGRIHFDCVTAMILLWILFFIFITGSFVGLLLRRAGARGCLSAATVRLFLGLRSGWRGQKLLPAMVAAKIECLSVAFSVQGGSFVHAHAADRVFGVISRFGHSGFLSWCCLCAPIFAVRLSAHMPFIGAIAAAGAAGAGGAKPVRILRCSSVRSLLASPTERMKARRSSPVSFPISPILISIFAASG